MNVVAVREARLRFEAVAAHLKAVERGQAELSEPFLGALHQLVGQAFDHLEGRAHDRLVRS